MKPTTTWIVIADGARARVLANHGIGKGVEQVKGADFRAESPVSAARGSDRPGRSFDSVGGGRHAMEASSDQVRLEKRAFLRRIADFLGDHAEKKSYDRLIVLAPAQALGDLRSELPEKVRALVMAEESRDLTPIPNEDIPKHLEGMLAV